MEFDLRLLSNYQLITLTREAIRTTRKHTWHIYKNQ